MRRLLILAPLVIGGCVGSLYHPVGSPSMSVIDANRYCAQVSSGPHYVRVAQVGALTGAFVGGMVAGVNAQKGRRLAQCMFRQGWQHN